MKTKGKLIAALVVFALLIGPMNVSATEIDSEDVTETEEVTQITESVAVSETSEEEGKTTQTDSSTEQETISEEIDTLAEYDEGLVYYLKKYSYDSKVTYLEEYVDYLDKQVKACEELCILGEMTEAEVSSFQAQYAQMNAELTVAKNESAYNYIYLKKNGLDYSNYSIDESKTVQDMEYYLENCSEKDYMVAARYVTDFNNAVAYMEAKKMEISALETSVSMMDLLYKEGEISELELLEKKVSLARAKYELVQHNVNRNIAFYNLEQMCQ